MGDGADEMMEREYERFFNASEAFAMLPQGYGPIAEWCEKEGYILKQCSEHHWQVALDSGPLVDFWPTANRARPYNAKKGMKASSCGPGELRRMVAQVRAGTDQHPKKSPVLESAFHITNKGAEELAAFMASQIGAAIAKALQPVERIIGGIVEASRLKNDLPPDFRSGVTTDLGTRFIRPEDRGQFPTAEQAMAETSPIQIDDLETATIVVPGPETIAAGEEFLRGMGEIVIEDQDGNEISRCPATPDLVVQRPKVPRYHDGLAAQVGDVVKRRDSAPLNDWIYGLGLHTVVRVEKGNEIYLRDIVACYGAHNFDLVQRAPADPPEHDYATEDALWEQGQADADRCECNHAEPHVEFVSIEPGAPPEGCEKCGIPPRVVDDEDADGNTYARPETDEDRDDRDGTFVEGDWLYEATFLVALHANLMRTPWELSDSESIIRAASIAKRAMEELP